MFRSCLAEMYVLLGYDASSLDDRFLAFRENVIFSSSTFKLPWKKDIAAVEDGSTALSRKIRSPLTRHHNPEEGIHKEQMVFRTKIEKGKRRKEVNVGTLLQRHLRTRILQTVALIYKFKVTQFAEYETI